MLNAKEAYERSKVVHTEICLTATREAIKETENDIEPACDRGEFYVTAHLTNCVIVSEFIEHFEKMGYRVIHKKDTLGLYYICWD